MGKGKKISAIPEKMEKVIGMFQIVFWMVAFSVSMPPSFL